MRRTFNIFSSPSQIATAEECPRPHPPLPRKPSVLPFCRARIRRTRFTDIWPLTDLAVPPGPPPRRRLSACRLAEGLRVGRDRSARKRRWNGRTLLPFRPLPPYRTHYLRACSSVLFSQFTRNSALPTFRRVTQCCGYIAAHSEKGAPSAGRRPARHRC